MRKFRTTQAITVTDTPPEPVRFLRYGSISGAGSVSFTQAAADDVAAYDCETGDAVQPSSIEGNVYSYSIPNGSALEFRKLSRVSLSAVSVTPASGRTASTYLDVVASEISPDVVAVGVVGRGQYLFLTVAGELTTEWSDWITACTQSSTAYFYALDEAQGSAYSGTPDGYVVWNAEHTDYGIGGLTSISAFGMRSHTGLLGYVLLSDYTNLTSVDVIQLGWTWSQASLGTSAELVTLLSDVAVTKAVVSNQSVIPDEDLLVNEALLPCWIRVTAVDQSAFTMAEFRNIVLIDPDTTLTAATSQENPTLAKDYAQYPGKTITSASDTDSVWGVLRNSRNATTELHGFPNSTNNYGLTGNEYPTGGQAGDVFTTPANGSSLAIDLILPQESGYATSIEQATTLSAAIEVNVIGTAITLLNVSLGSGTHGAFQLTGAGGKIDVMNDEGLHLNVVDFSSYTSRTVKRETISGSPTANICFRCDPSYEPAQSAPIITPVYGSGIPNEFTTQIFKLDCDELKRIGKLANIFNQVIAGTTGYGFGFSDLYLYATTPAVIAEAVGYFNGANKILTSEAALRIYVPDQESLTAAQAAYAALTNPPASPTITFAVAA